MRRRKLFGAFSILAVLASVVVIGASSGMNPASAWVGPNNSLTSTVDLDCLATAPVVGDVPTTQSISLTTQAPGKVEAGETFDLFAQSPAQTAPADFTGYGINYLTGLEVRIPLPAGATHVAGEGIVAGTGFNYGSGATFTWDSANNRYILKTTGNIAGGSNFQLPQVKLVLQASGAPGSIITPKVGGNSKANFGFALSVNGNFPSPIGTTTVPIACWPKNPNPALSSTTIIPVDTLGPAITITSPLDAGNYGLNATANANYSCNDGTNGTGVATCTGPVASGSPIDTSSLGVKSFTVNATDAKGNASSKTVTYNVVDLPSVVANPVWTTEGSPAAFALTLTKPWPTAVTVNYATANGTATAGTDYTATSGSRTFAPNSITTGVINVTTAANTTYQGNRNFNLNLTGVTGGLIGTPSIEGRILDNETPPPSAVGVTVTEGVDATADFTISLPFDPGVPVSVSYTTVNGFAIAGNDYTTTTGTWNFTPGGPLTQVVSVPILDDGQDDGYALDFSLAVTNVATGESGQPGISVIVDNDGPLPPAVNVGATVSDSTIVEGDDTSRTAWVTVKLDKPVTTPVTFLYQTADGTATVAGKDYKAEGKVLTFEPGQTTRAVSIPVTPDTVNEGDENFYVDLTFVGGGNPIGDPQGVVTIIDDDNPTSSGYVVSVGDAQTFEGNAGLGIVDIPVTMNKKRAKTASDYNVEVQLTVAYGTASATDVSIKTLTSKITFAGGVNKNLQIKVRGDTVVEPDETLTVTASATPNTPGSVSFGKSSGTLTIRDDDGISGPPTSPKATTSKTKLGYVDLTWAAPITGQAASGYEWRVSTDGVMDNEPWANTGIGLTRHLEHNCGAGATCLYQVRTVNPVGASAPSGVVSGTGLQDLVGPNLLVFTPKAGANVEDYGTLTYNGLIGTDFGDAATISAKVYACNGCTNIAPTQTLAPSISGAGWSATGAALTAGVYTLQVTQTDWAGHTTEVLRTFQTRPAIFVSPLGNDTTGTGTAANPYATISKGLSSTTVGKPEVAVGQGTYGALTVGNSPSNRTILGGFDQYAGWVRPGTAGVPGTANPELTNIEAAGTAVVFNGSNNITMNGLRIHGTNVGLGAGSSVYGARALSGATATLQNVRVVADSGVAGTNGSDGTAGASGGGGGNGGLGGEPCTSYIPATVPGGAGGSGGAFAGGAGGNGRCNNSGVAGATGASSGGTGGTAGASSGNALCNNASNGGAGGAGTAGAAGTTAGAAGTSGTAGTTWAGANGTTGSAGTSGRGGGGGGGGGGHTANIFGAALCSGFDAGGSGGGGGAGGGGGGAGTLGAAGGGSFGVYVHGSTVNLDAQTVVITGAGGAGGAGGNGGAGGSGGAGGTGGSVTNQDNGGTPTGNASPTFCFLSGLFGISACFPDGGAGAGGAGGSAGGGGAGGGGGYGGPSAPVLTASSGVVNLNGATLTKGAAGLGGAGGLAGPNGTPGAPGTIAIGAWSATPAAGAAGASATGTPAAGGNGTAGFSCSRWDSGVCTP